MPISLWDWFPRFNRRGYQPLGQNTQSSLGARHFQCFLVFCGLSVAYALRVNLSVAIVAMTDRNSTNPEFTDFYDWDAKTKSLLLSSFFWGYVVTQIPGGFLAHKYGAKFTLFTGIAVCSVLALLTPLAAEIGSWRLVFALRVIQGLCQGVVFPSTHTFLSKWAPAEERGRLVTYCYSGTQFGTVVMLASSGFIASSFLGWPSIFYVSGFAGILWAFVWVTFAASSPSDHRTISEEEKRYIESGMNQPRDNRRTTVLPTPWCKIATSLPFISLLIVHCGQNWGFWTLLTEIPNYMKNVLQKDIKSNAMLSALPYLAMCLLSYVFIFISDFLNKKKYLSLSVSRKLFNSIGHWVPMVALIALGYVTAEHKKLAIALLTIAVGVNSATYLGFQVNHIDLSPNFAGTLMGITNCAANVMSIVAPLTVGIIVTEETNPLQWRLVFFITGGFYLVGNALFLLFGKTEVQPWNYPSPRERRSSDQDALLDPNGAQII
ncbi:putative inorganic phosphate cotransporter [Episyrphus balteatus]|uniref:putative inorganic phosphate cotransporter n=1 Tax=Episyrphus balteatus TaxID=286459 RepID=UPI0024867B50|nr:putative inorganic phosphate cotransporter [Episyrphus balteatus]